MRFLTENNYMVSTAKDASAAKNLLKALTFDLLIVDVMMPGEDGIDLTRGLTKKIETPILLLTAKNGFDDRIIGLESGAEDYLPKPFEPRELLLRLEIILRRSKNHFINSPPDRVLYFGRLLYNLDREELWDGRKQVKLTTSEVSILNSLIKNVRSPVDRHDLAIALCEHLPEQKKIRDAKGNLKITMDQQRAIDVYITRLRKKMETNLKSPRYIKTVRGIGYLVFPD